MVPLFSALVFVIGIAMLVLLAEPPGVVVAIIVVAAVGVLLRTLVPSLVWGRARWRRVNARAVTYRPPGTSPDQ